MVRVLVAWCQLPASPQSAASLAGFRMLNCLGVSGPRGFCRCRIVISRPQLLTRPTVVMGANGKVGDVLNAGVVERDGVAVIKRFTGGGTVALGKDAVLTSIVSSLVSKAMG